MKLNKDYLLLNNPGILKIDGIESSQWLLTLAELTNIANVTNSFQARKPHLYIRAVMISSRASKFTLVISN